MADIRLFTISPKPTKQRVRICCPECGKEVHGHSALMQHENAKHGGNHSMLTIDTTRDKELGFTE